MLKRIKLPFIIATVILVLTTAFGPTVVHASAPVGSYNIRNKLLFLRNDDIWTFDIVQRTELQLTHSGNIRNYCVSADANKIAYVKGLKKLYVYDVASGSEQFITDTETDASQPSFSPLGDKVALISLIKEKVQVRFNYFTEPVQQRVRHIWIADLKTKSMMDVTPGVPFQHSEVRWSPDGRWLSFASFRIGMLEMLSLNAKSVWKVYLMDLNDPKHKTIEIGGGMSSVWLNSDQVVVSEGVAANVLSIYDVKTKTKKPATMFRAGFSAPTFSFGGLNNDVVYYEVILDADGDGMIRSHNIQSNKTDDIVKNASAPLFVK